MVPGPRGILLHLSFLAFVFSPDAGTFCLDVGILLPDCRRLEPMLSDIASLRINLISTSRHERDNEAAIHTVSTCSGTVVAKAISYSCADVHTRGLKCYHYDMCLFTSYHDDRC